jgi:hypothetical protein
VQRSTRGTSTATDPLSAETKVRYLDTTISIEQKIMAPQIAMNNVESV